MDASYKRYIIGTKKRPTMFLTTNFNETAIIEYADQFCSEEEALGEIAKCDEPDELTLYEATVIIHGI